MNNYIIIYVLNSKCQHFWHFMMGEFLPIVYLAITSGVKNIYLYNPVRKWNLAFDRFYKDIEKDNLKFYFVNNMNLKRKVDKTEFIYYKPWDKYWINSDLSVSKCQAVIKWLKINTINYCKTNEIKLEKMDVIIQLRKTNSNLSNYFKHIKIGTLKYGACKRNYKDMNILKDYYSELNLSIKECYSDNMHLYKQIYEYLYHDKLVLAHGAGMFFILFMNNNSKIIEIMPGELAIQNKPAVQSIIRLCKLKNSNFKRVILENNESITKLCKKDFYF